MRESVAQPKNAWLVGIAVCAVGVGYLMLLGSSRFSEPGPSLDYDMKPFEDLDNVPCLFTEAPAIPCGIDNPRALAVRGDKIFLSGENAIVEFDMDGKETGRLPFDGTAHTLAVAPDGTIYAGLQKSVRVLDADGKLRSEWTEFTDRSFVTAIAVNGEDVYVADAGKRVVLRFDRQGKLQSRIGEKDEARDIPGLEAPSPYLDVAVNPDGDTWVVNPGKLGLEQYRPDGSLVTSWYKPSVTALDGFPGCCNPTQIAFDSRGNLFTCEKGLVRLKEFEVTAGTFDGLVAPSELFPQEQAIRDIAVDSRDRLLVLDGQQKVIRVFARKETSNGSASQPH